MLRVDGPDELDLAALGDARDRRRHRRRERARGSRRGGDREARARATASSACTSPTRTSTSRRRRELRELIPALDAVAAFAFGGDPHAGTRAEAARSSTTAASTRPPCSPARRLTRPSRCESARASSASSNVCCSASASSAGRTRRPRPRGTAVVVRARRRERFARRRSRPGRSAGAAPAAAQDLLAARDADRHDRHAARSARYAAPGCSGWIFGPSGGCPRGTPRARSPACSIAIESRTRLAVGAVARDREPAERAEDRAEHRDAEDLDLAHEADAALRHEREERDVHHRPVRRREDVAAGRAAVAPAPTHAHPEQHAGALGDDPPDDAVEEHGRVLPRRAEALDDLGDDLVDRTAGRVDHERIVGRPQRRRRPAAVERVAPRSASCTASTSTVPVGGLLVALRGGGPAPRRRRRGTPSPPRPGTRRCRCRGPRPRRRRAARPTSRWRSTRTRRTRRVRRHRRHRGGDLGAADLCADVAAVEPRRLRPRPRSPTAGAIRAHAASSSGATPASSTASVTARYIAPVSSTGRPSARGDARADRRLARARRPVDRDDVASSDSVIASRA